jgi:hypothetical protein
VTTEQIITPGAEVGLVMTLAMQEAIVNGLAILAEDRHAVEVMVGRSDSLLYSSADEWRDALRAALYEMIDPGNDQHADVLIGYPSPPGECRLPAISIVTQSGGENVSEAVCGDLLRTSYDFHGPNQELWKTSEYGAGQTSTLEIGAWSPAPERAELLIAAVKHVLYQQKPLLLARGIHDLSYREGSAPVEPSLEPRVAHCPMLSVTMGWTFRTATRRKVPNRATLITTFR